MKLEHAAVLLLEVVVVLGVEAGETSVRVLSYPCPCREDFIPCNASALVCCVGGWTAGMVVGNDGDEDDDELEDKDR